MKKSLIALAVMAAAGAASAQSSVTLFGIVDATLQWGRGSVADRYQLGNSGYNSSRLGFRGTEDLGGGMSASFWLEAGMNNDNGTGSASNTNNQASGGGTAPGGTQGLTFNRRSTVSLAGRWGEVRLGRDYNPSFWNLTVFDPFGTNGVGSSVLQTNNITGVTNVRASNSIGYFLPPNLGGVYGQLMVAEGENTPGATEDDGDLIGGRIGFASGPFNVAAGYSRTKYAAGKVRQSNLGGQWDFGVAKLMAGGSWDKNGALDGRGWLIGALVPVGAGEIRVALDRYRIDTGVAGAARAQTTKLAIGYVHNLSKRTAIYTTWAGVRNRGGATTALNGATTGVNGNSTGLDLGIRHSF